MPEYMFPSSNNWIIRTVEFLNHAVIAPFWKGRVDLPASMLAHAQIQVLRQDGKTLFLNPELLARLDMLIDDAPLENAAQAQPIPVE